MAIGFRPPSARVLCGGLFAALVQSSAAPASASQLAVALDYSAESNCPDAGYFKAVVVERLGFDAFVQSAPKRVIVDVSSHDQTFEGRMEWRDDNGNWAGERTFPSRSSDCEDLVRAMAFTLALQLQLSTVPSETEGTSAIVQKSERPAVAPVATTAQPVVSTPPVVQHEPPTQSNKPTSITPVRPNLSIGAGALLGLGMLRSAVPLARIFGSVAWPNWSLELATEASLPTTIRRADGAGFTHQQVMATVAGCGISNWFSACLVAKAGEVRVAGKNIDDPTSAMGPVFETGLRARATQPIYGRAYMAVYADALLRPVLWAVTLDRSVVWTSPRFTRTIGFDVALRFE